MPCGIGDNLAQELNSFLGTLPILLEISYLYPAIRTTITGDESLSSLHCGQDAQVLRQMFGYSMQSYMLGTTLPV